MCQVMGVSRSGDYEWRSRPVRHRALEDQRLGGLIKEIFTSKRCVYGTRRIQEELADKEEIVSRNRISRLMAAQDLKCKTKRKFKVTTDSKHNLPVAPNRLERGFDVQRPNQVYVGDISYIPIAEGWLYLAVFIDLFFPG